MSSTFVRARRWLAVWFLGFSSGLPLALTGQAMQAWLTVAGVDLATIGFLGLVGLPYTFKFLWAPLMDRFDLPWLGRRRGWIVLSQWGLTAALAGMAHTSPVEQPALFALLAVLVAFLSASQDVVVDAYRTDVLPNKERGLGGSLTVFGYRLAMILSGGVTLIWAEQWGSWPMVYLTMAAIMAACAVISALFMPALDPVAPSPSSHPRREIVGFGAMILGFAAGWFGSMWILQLLGFSPTASDRWGRLVLLLVQVSSALTLAAWASQRAGFETLHRSLQSYFRQPGAWAFLALIVLYKLSDAFAGVLTTPFLISGMGFGQAEVGIVNKIFGLWLTIGGAVLAGFMMLRLSLYRALLLFGALQLVSNVGFWYLATVGKGAWGSLVLPSFDLVIVALDKSTEIDRLLLAVIAGENLAGGMGTAALVALMMSLCQRQFSATHFALLSALAAVGRIYVSPLAGVLSESLGWPNFFVFSVLIGVPGVLAVAWLRTPLQALEVCHRPYA